VRSVAASAGAVVDLLASEAVRRLHALLMVYRPHMYSGLN
jgi:hypothetical protein